MSTVLLETVFRSSILQSSSPSAFEHSNFTILQSLCKAPKECPMCLRAEQCSVKESQHLGTNRHTGTIVSRKLARRLAMPDQRSPGEIDLNLQKG